MQVPPEIVLKDVEMTPLIDRLFARGLDRLEQVCDYIISTRIALEREQARHQTGNLYRMRIDIRIPDRQDIVAKRWSKAARKNTAGDERAQTEMAIEEEAGPEEVQRIGRIPVPRKKRPEEPLRALVRRTFDSARRELEKVMNKQRGRVKTHPQQQP